VRTKHFVRAVWSAPVSQSQWHRRDAAGVGTARRGAGGAAGHVRDSLLVSDSIYQGWKWWHVYCFRCHAKTAMRQSSRTRPTCVGR